MAQADLIPSQVNVTRSVPIAVPLPGGGFVMWFVPTGSNTPPLKMKASPIGELQLELKEYRPRRMGQ